MNDAKLYSDGFEYKLDTKPVYLADSGKTGKAIETTVTVVSSADKANKVANKVVDGVTSHATDLDPISWILDAVNGLVTGVGALTKFIEEKKTKKVKEKAKKYEMATKVISTHLEKKAKAEAAEAEMEVEAQKKHTQKVLMIAGASVAGLLIIGFIASQTKE